MRIIVTGGLGFIGQEIVSRLLDDGHVVVIVDYWKHLISRYEVNRFPIILQVYRTVPRCEMILEPDELGHLDCRFDVIVHAGAVVNTTDMGQNGALWKSNVTYIEELCKAFPLTPMVFLSSASVYGNGDNAPNNPYGLSKAMGEAILRRHSQSVISLRLFNVFGRNEHHKGKMASLPWKLAQAYRNDDRFELHSPDAARDFVPVDLVVESVVHAIKLARINAQYKVFDVGTGSATTLSDLDDYVAQACGRKESCLKIVDMPHIYVGRYQGYTKAGMKGVTNIVSDLTTDKPLTTRAWIEKYYGK